MTPAYNLFFRYLFVLILTLGCHLPADAQQANRPKVAVVLSGGGAKGMAHIGVLKVLQRAGIPIDIVTGTSMGSLIGGLYAVGWNADELDSLVRHQDWSFLLSDKDDYYAQNLLNRQKQNTYFLSKRINLGGSLLSSTGGLVRGHNLAILFNHLTSGYNDSINFDSLPIPFSCVATNIVDNTEYDFHAGRLPQAMRASMSIPGMFAPIRKGDAVLVDGGLRNNYPADIARQMGADYIIGSTVQGPPKTADDLTSGAGVIGQIVDVNCKNKYDENLALTQIAIRVNTSGYSAANFSAAAVDTLINRGEQEAMKHWGELMQLKHTLGLDSTYTPHYLHAPDAARQPVSYAIHPDSSHTHGASLEANVALRYDTEERVAMQLNGVYSPGKGKLQFEGTVRLGKRLGAWANVAFNASHFLQMALQYGYSYNDIDYYLKGHHDFNVRYNHHQATFALNGLSIRNLALDLKVQWDYFNYHQLLISRQYNNSTFHLADNHFFSYQAALHYNSHDNGVFPTRGRAFMAHYAYNTDNLISYHGKTGFSEVSSMWDLSIPIGKVVSLHPMVYGRLLFGSNIPYVKYNFIGGNSFGHYMSQQLPFAGIQYTEPIKNHVVATQLALQLRLTENNYLLFKSALAFDDDQLKQIFQSRPFAGFQAGYYYNWLIGPIGTCVNYNTLSNTPSFYINIGLSF